MVSFALVTASSADVVPPPKEVEMVDVPSVQSDVATVKLTLVAPAGTLTAAGTKAIGGLLLETPIDAPPEGVADVRVTVAVTGSQPARSTG